MPITTSWGRRAAVPALLLGVAACGAPTSPPNGGGQQGPPPLVQVFTVRSEAIPNIIELPGRIQAVRTAEVRARVDGIVQRRLYREGTDVAAGTPLFEIDPREMSAQARQARAVLTRAEAARVNARQVVNRYTPLLSDRSVSALEFDRARSDLSQAEANVADARAALARSELQLGYATVRAPIAGRVGSAQVTEGALVSAGNATLMTTVDQLSTVYAVFTQSNASALDLVQFQRTGRLAVPSLSRIEVRLTLANGTEYGVSGHLDFAAQSVDPSTGSQVLRAVFDNGDRLLLPGQFARGRIFLGTVPGGIMVPVGAVQMAQDKATVSVVGPDGVASARTVELGNQVDGRWIVLAGLRPGDRVITAGWQKVQPGQPVRIKGEPPRGPRRGER